MRSNCSSFFMQYIICPVYTNTCYTKNKNPLNMNDLTFAPDQLWPRFEDTFKKIANQFREEIIKENYLKSNTKTTHFYKEKFFPEIASALQLEMSD